MLTAYLRPVSHSIGRCELTFRQKREPIDYEKAVRQHAAYRDCLAELGVQTMLLPAEHELPDAVFVEDTAIVVDEVAVIPQMGAPARRREVTSSAAALASHRPLRRINRGGTLEGGDVVRIGRTLYVGLSRRTNSDGINELRMILEPLDYCVRAVNVTGCLHLGTGASYIGRNTLLANRSWIDVTQFNDFDVIDVPRDEPWSANTLLIGNTILLPSASDQTREMLEKRRFPVKVVDISELEKAEAGLTCLSLRLNLPTTQNESLLGG
jgi:dimethylargininase